MNYPWETFARKEDWIRVTRQSPDKGFLLLIWRESGDRNFFLQVPYYRIPVSWLWELKTLDDRYLEEESEKGADSNANRLLGLVYCTLYPPKNTLKTIWFAAQEWPVSSVSGMWQKYIVPPESVQKDRAGLVVCTGIQPPEE